jgi:hypothetical protein
MPSIISAGTTANTGLNLTADTSGNLVFQTNGNTTAMTIDTSQNVTYANGVSFTGVIGGNGANISSMNASNLTSGTVANARTTAASANGASTIVLRDTNGNFTANAATLSSGVFSGSSSGTATLQAPAVAGTTTITLPSSTGTIALTSDITTPKVINVQTVTNSTRASLSSAGSTPVTLTTFTYNKQSASSSLIFIVMVPMDGSVSGTCACDLTYGSSSAFGSLYYSFTGETFIQVMQGQATLTGYTTTGSQTLTVRYYTADNSGGKPADTVNPNSSDDSRMIQTVSTATVIEYS